MDPQAPVTFEAVIIPHRSLGRLGMRWVVGLLCGLSGGISAGLWWAGAWPVIGFNGAEIGLAVLLLWRNARRAGASELLILSGAGLRIIRTEPGGRRMERTLRAGWLSAYLEERPGRTPALWLRDRARQMEIGADLGEAEKRDLAAALSDALYRQRHPVFDNPQLRRDADSSHRTG